MNRKVIYTAVVGSYDNILQPKATRSDYDYILYSNDINKQHIGIWEIRSIPYDNKDKTRIARWVKTHPHKLLKEYEASVWLDSNITIVSEDFYTIIENLQRKNILISSMAHPERDCIYEECLPAFFYYKRDSLYHMIPEIIHLKHQNYPKHNGLCETGCLYRKHEDYIISRFNDYWWNMINKYSKRDQLSFNYALWENNISIHYMLGHNFCVRNHHAFQYHGHSIIHNDIAWRDVVVNGKARIRLILWYNRMLTAANYSPKEIFYAVSTILYGWYIEYNVKFFYHSKLGRKVLKILMKIKNIK